jgi:formylglycine-generating enzyme required for sulfatase activity
MTDADHHSDGHATLVLGTAVNPETNQLEHVAFLDKLQNIPTQKIELFLDAVSRSLATQGYKLGIPTDLGKDIPEHGGLSNMEVITDFVQINILSRLSQVRAGFTPHPHRYSFENAYSRGDSKLEVRIFQAKALKKGIEEIRPGKNYASYTADNGFNKNRLVQDLINLRDSPQEQDALKYISRGPVIGQLEELGLFSQKEFLSDLGKIMNDNSKSFQVRRQACYEILLLSNNSNDGALPDFQSAKFSEAEKVQMISEIKQWSKSSDKRKKQFVEGIDKKWFFAARTGNETIMNGLMAWSLVDINQKNNHGYSALTIAVQNHRVRVVSDLLANPKINVLDTDNKGFTVLDHALALGHQDLIDFIKKKRPEIKWSANEKTASRVHQTIDFIRVAPGSFEMGADRIPTTISKLVDIMSTLLTQKMYLKIMGQNLSKFQDGENTVIMNAGKNNFYKLQPDNPVEQVSYEDGVQLLKKINELSKRDSPLLYEVIPGHTRGAQYDFITEAQMEYVMKKAKTEDGDTLDEMIKRNDMEKLKQYVVYNENSGNSTQPVGSKKPLYIDGKPIYDLNGNVWVWVKDWYQRKLTGGTDPQGPKSGLARGLRGGSWDNDAHYLHSADRSKSRPGVFYNNIGLRLARTAP